jgi:glycosyltransferase involved in cell wall biosynthesis
VGEPIRILFNATAVGSSGGVTVLEGLMGSLLALPDVACRFLVSADLQERLSGYKREDVIFERFQSTAQRLVWEQTRLPKLLLGPRWDVLVGLTNTLPLRAIPREVKSVVFVQNIAPLTPDVVLSYRGVGRLRLEVLRRMTERSVRRADLTLLFTDAGCELVRTAVPGARTAAVPPGGFPVDVAASERSISTPPYVVVLADLYRYKGVEDVIRAVAGPELRSVHLRVLGSPMEKDYAERLVRLARDLSVSDRVHFLGRRPRDEVVGHLMECTALIQPSRCESLALPVIEASQLGVSVISTDIPVVRELCGDRASFYPPGDVPALIAAISSVFSGSDTKLPGSTEPASEHDWGRTASALVSLAVALLERVDDP